MTNDPLGLFDESPTASGNDPLGLFEGDESSTEAAGRKSSGLLQAGMGMVAGLPSQIAGGLVGLGSVMSGQGIDEAVRKQEAVQKSNFGFGEFKPWTETGEKYSEAAGKGVEKVLKAPGTVLGKFSPEAQLASDVIMEAGANFLPLPFGVKGMRGSANVVNKLRDRGHATSADVQSGVDALLARKAEEKAAAQVVPEDAPIQGPTLPNREGVGNARTTVENPTAARMDPMERMANDLGATADLQAPNGRSPMTDMANDLNRPTSPETRAADQTMADRQTAMEQEMKQRVTLEQNARMRAEQERAPVTSPEMQAHADAVKQAQVDAQAAEAAVAKAKADADAEMLGSRARAEANQRAADAQEQLRLRQVALEEAVKRQTSLDMNAAERARQEAAPAVSENEARYRGQLEERRLADEANKAQNMHQMEIDDTPHVLPDTNQLYADQYGVRDGVGRIDENGMPIRADRSLEAQHLENPLQRNLWGDELKDSGLTGKDRSMTAALDKLQHSDFKGDLRDQALSMLGDQRAMNNMKSQRGHLNKDLSKAVASAVRWFTASPEHGRTKGYTLEEQAARKNANEQRYGPGQYIAENRDFSSVYGGPNGRMYAVSDPFKKPFDIDKPGNQKTYDTIVKMAGSKAEANKKLAAAGYDAITFTSPRGDKLANIFKEAKLTDIGPAREKAKAIALEDLKLAEYEPGVDRSGLYKRQGGVIKMPGHENAVEAMKRIAGFAANMRNVIPEKLTPEQFVEKYKGAKDIVQNAAQKASNQLTKGGIYLAERLDNPLFSRVVDDFLSADGRAKAAINEFVNKDYTPKLRALSKQEFTDTWAALRKFEAAGVRPTAAEMASANLSAKQRALIDSHWNLMDNIFPKINETLARLGIDPISPEAAYVATKATGTFRQPVYKGEKLVGYVGNDSRAGLAKDIKKYLALDPEYHAGPEVVMNNRGKSTVAEGIQDTLNWLKSNDPDIAQFLEHTKNVMDSSAFKYRGSNTHTMSKTGIEGLPGNKPWEDAYTNAKDGFEAQVAYAKRMFEWAEKAKAVESTQALLNSPELNMPVAKQMATDYMDAQLGRNPTIAGRAIDDAFAEINRASGGKARWAGKIGEAARAFAYAKFLKLDLGFLYTQLIQAPTVMPEMGALLSARGSGGNMLTALAKAMTVKDEIHKGAIQYAKDNHVYAPDMIGHSDSVRRDAAHVWDMGTNAIAAKVESATRQAMYLTLVRKMADGGLTPEKGLYAAGARLTDMAMGNYSRAEAPRVYQQLGAAGSMPYTLSTYKHNELSRLAMLAREAGDGSVRPLITAMASQVARAGLFGTVGFKATEQAVEFLTGIFGDKPVNLTKLMLDNADKQIVPGVSMKNAAYGAHSYANMDFSGRVGMGEILPTGLDMIMPGTTSIVQGAKDLGDLAGDRSMYNAKKAMVDILPGGRHMEGFFFNKPIPDSENTMGINRNKAEASVIRTPAESLMKKFGVTSVNENMEKALQYQNGKMDKRMDDQKKAAVLSMKKDILENGSIDKKYFDQYLKAEGSEDALDGELEGVLKATHIPAKVRDLIRVENAPKKLIRRFGN